MYPRNIPILEFVLLVALMMASLQAVAGEGASPWSQADQYYGQEDMRKARRTVQAEHGAKPIYFVEGDRLEYQSGEHSPLLLFEGQGWWGTDANKLWIKTETEYALDNDRFEAVELQTLWSHAILPFFDLQAGVRHDREPDPSRSFGVVGIQGLAPYWFEIDAALFVSGNGDVSARLEAEYDLPLTQRLILQPRAELNLAVQSVDSLGIGGGLSDAELGLRLRYEFLRQFAPYIGLSWLRVVGRTADFARADGQDTETVSLVLGLRFWF
jgi:copper resistance protein B